MRKTLQIFQVILIHFIYFGLVRGDENSFDVDQQRACQVNERVFSLFLFYFIAIEQAWNLFLFSFRFSRSNVIHWQKSVDKIASVWRHQTIKQHRVFIAHRIAMKMSKRRFHLIKCDLNSFKVNILSSKLIKVQMLLSLTMVTMNTMKTIKRRRIFMNTANISKIIMSQSKKRTLIDRRLLRNSAFVLK